MVSSVVVSWRPAGVQRLSAQADPRGSFYTLEHAADRRRGPEADRGTGMAPDTGSRGRSKNETRNHLYNLKTQEVNDTHRLRIQLKSTRQNGAHRGGKE